MPPGETVSGFSSFVPPRGNETTVASERVRIQLLHASKRERNQLMPRRGYETTTSLPPRGYETSSWQHSCRLARGPGSIAATLSWASWTGQHRLPWASAAILATWVTPFVAGSRAGAASSSPALLLTTESSALTRPARCLSADIERAARHSSPSALFKLCSRFIFLGDWSETKDC